MTATAEPVHADAARVVRDHLWMHFASHNGQDEADTPVIVRGEGAYLYDDKGKRYLDGLAGLFAVQVGHGREELAEAAARQMRTLPYFPIWGYAHPPALELADRLAASAPGDLNRVFFTVSGGESVETAWKLARQYFKVIGRPTKHKAISRSMAYHGTSLGALSITGIPGAKAPFEPLVPSTIRVPNTNFYRATEHTDAYDAYGLWAADRIEEAILMEAWTPWPRSSWNRCRTPAAVSSRRPGTSSACARSAIGTMCCSSPMRSSARSGGSEPPSAHSVSAISRI